MIGYFCQPRVCLLASTYIRGLHHLEDVSPALYANFVTDLAKNDFTDLIILMRIFILADKDVIPRIFFVPQLVPQYLDIAVQKLTEFLDSNNMPKYREICTNALVDSLTYVNYSTAAVTESDFMSIEDLSMFVSKLGTYVKVRFFLLFNRIDLNLL